MKHTGGVGGAKAFAVVYSIKVRSMHGNVQAELGDVLRQVQSDL
jgi:hypothetical protein